MAKFSEIRDVAIKRTEDDDKHFDVTPRRISPFDANGRVKSEFAKMADEIRWPTYNRARRRQSGQIAKPQRLHRQLPPHPLAVINKAHQIEREGARETARRARVSLAYEGDYRSVRQMLKDKAAQR